MVRGAGLLHAIVSQRRGLRACRHGRGLRFICSALRGVCFSLTVVAPPWDAVVQRCGRVRAGKVRGRVQLCRRSVCRSLDRAPSLFVLLALRYADAGWRSWSAKDVSAWASNILQASSCEAGTISATSRTLVQQDIVGEALAELTLADLMSMSVPLGAAKVLLSAIATMKQARVVSAQKAAMLLSPLSAAQRAASARASGGGLSFLVGAGSDTDSDSGSSTTSSSSMEAALLGAIGGTRTGNSPPLLPLACASTSLCDICESDRVSCSVSLSACWCCRRCRRCWCGCCCCSDSATHWSREYHVVNCIWCRWSWWRCVGLGCALLRCLC
jgi:hypothetical protein